MLRYGLCLVLFLSLSACVSSADLATEEQEWTMAPASVDQSLSRDDQFLQKSQHSYLSRSQKNSYLHP